MVRYRGGGGARGGVRSCSRGNGCQARVEGNRRMRGELVVRFLLKGYETKRYEEDLYSDLGNSRRPRIEPSSEVVSFENPR